MANVFLVGAAALDGELERLRVIGQNFANAATVGYRAEISVRPAVLFSTVLDNEPPATVLQSAKLGALRQTSQTLDLALGGPGYFVLKSAEGYRYTRRGDFHVGTDGLVHSSKGYEVMGSGFGSLRNLDSIEIDHDGTLFDNGRPAGRIDVVEFGSDAVLVHEGGGVYSSTSAPDSSSSPDVRQGYLEQSNVDPATETVQMMQVVRRVGMVTRAIRAYDSMLDAAVNELGNG